MNHLPWDIGYSTDREIRTRFKVLEEKYDLEFYFPHNLLSSVKPVCSHFYKAVKHKLPFVKKAKRFGISNKMGQNRI